MKLLKIIFSFLLAVTLPSFAMDLETEVDDRSSEMERLDAFRATLPAGTQESFRRFETPFINFASKTRQRATIECPDKAGCTLAALAQQKLLNESSAYDSSQFIKRNIEVDHSGFVSQVRAMVGVMDITGVAPTMSKEGTLYFPLKDNTQDYPIALTVIKQFDFPGALSHTISICQSSHGLDCNLNCLNLAQQFTDKKASKVIKK